MQIFSLTHEKERLIIRLGELIYSDYKKNQITILNEKAMEIIDKIKKTDDKIKEKKEELKKEQ
jgi:hypothetical protein